MVTAGARPQKVTCANRYRSTGGGPLGGAAATLKRDGGASLMLVTSSVLVPAVAGSTPKCNRLRVDMFDQGCIKQGSHIKPLPSVCVVRVPHNP